MSIEMLQFLARNCRDLRVLLLGTNRSEEVLNKEKGVHPFLESLRIMKRESLCTELHRKPFHLNEIKESCPQYHFHGYCHGIGLI